MVRTYMLVLILLFSLAKFVNAQTVDTMDVEFVFIEEAPYFKGDLKEFIQGELTYPSSAIKDSIEGMVVISFTIDTSGLTINHRIIRGIRDDLNNEALRVAKQIKFDKPALQKGKPIAVKFVVPVIFDLQSQKEAMCDYINDKEAVWLNKLASLHGIEYDFTGKKVAFYTGSGADARRSKEDFLSKCRNIDDEYNPNSFYTPRIYIFNEEEKKKADEYDAVIVYGSVKQLPSKKTLIRRLHRFCFLK